MRYDVGYFTINIRILNIVFIIVIAHLLIILLSRFTFHLPFIVWLYILFVCFVDLRLRVRIRDQSDRYLQSIFAEQRKE